MFTLLPRTASVVVIVQSETAALRNDLIRGLFTRRADSYVSARSVLTDLNSEATVASLLGSSLIVCRRDLRLP